MAARFSEDQLREYSSRTGLAKQHLGEGALPDTEAAKTGKTAPGQTARGEMNKTEQRFYNEVIWPEILSGVIDSFKFEEITLSLGPGCSYRPDFQIVFKDKNKRITFFEIKGGYIREKGRVKFKTAVDKYPEFGFELWQFVAGAGWKVLERYSDGVFVESD